MSSLKTSATQAASEFSDLRAITSMEALTASADCLPCEQQAAEARAAAGARAEAEGETSAADETGEARPAKGFTTDLVDVGGGLMLPNPCPWSGDIVFEGELTGDCRFIEPGALRWDLPQPLRHVKTDVGGHENAINVGSITEMERTSSGRIKGRGWLDLGSPEGREAARLVHTGTQDGVSADMDDVSYEIRIKSDIFEQMIEPAEEAPEPAEPETDGEGRVTVAEGHPDDEVFVITSARVRGATLVSIPAFIDARIALDLDAEAPAEDTLVASAAPEAAPRAWFEDPRLTGPTALRVTEDGRVFGHLALWGTCHTGFAGQCVTPPRSAAGYAYFATGAYRTAEGTEVAVGPLTLDTLHADKSLSAMDTLAHYENTGAAVAYVAVGEDEHGVWVAGAMRHEATDEQRRALRASPISGDWRRLGGNLELVAALAVNTPGFPVPRPSALVAGGAVQALVAAGSIKPDSGADAAHLDELSADDLAALKAVAARERLAANAARRTMAAGLLDRVKRAERQTQVAEMAAKIKTT